MKSRREFIRCFHQQAANCAIEIGAAPAYFISPIHHKSRLTPLAEKASLSQNTAGANTEVF
jgi:hypothetical protein